MKGDGGVGIVEVPRGMLIHDYALNSKGYCTKANCIIPTNQNHANIQLDMEKLVPEIIDKQPKEIELLLEMLVRAYDPCIFMLSTRLGFLLMLLSFREHLVNHVCFRLMK